MIFLRNINVPAGLCNGTRVIVCCHTRRQVTVRVLKAREGEPAQYAIIPLVTLYSKSESASYRFKRKQSPLRPAFCMTVNKGQGQTLECVGVDLQTPFLAHGQCYVAFSRSTNPDNAKVLLNDKNQRRVRNVVFSDIFDYLQNPVEVRDEMQLIAADQQAELPEDDLGREPEGIVFEEEENGPMMGDDNDE